MQWRRALTENELEQLQAAAAEAGGFPAGMVVLQRFYELALADLGTSLAEFRTGPARTLDPKEFAIPEEQWLAICTVLHDRARVDTDAHGLQRTQDPALMWMNAGPTTYLAQQELEVLDQYPGPGPMDGGLDLGVKDEETLGLVRELEP